MAGGERRICSQKEFIAAQSVLWMHHRTFAHWWRLLTNNIRFWCQLNVRLQLLRGNCRMFQRNLFRRCWKISQNGECHLLPNVNDLLFVVECVHNLLYSIFKCNNVSFRTHWENWFQIEFDSQMRWVQRGDVTCAERSITNHDSQKLSSQTFVQ